ncbi:MAG TPA: hypothetical protein VNS22_18790 [Geminicoccus sp.]|uniref:hypothetical protein n=1 Tax=Geminicoccus sp. TaxID=2024832 RepID=UPI002B6E2E5C|nr:hypothetical protein [Geminicoccus sp.]HWL70407.1 hypothetical protein [Geminicoccus sp.]
MSAGPGELRALEPGQVWVPTRCLPERSCQVLKLDGGWVELAVLPDHDGATGYVTRCRVVDQHRWIARHGAVLVEEGK